MLIARHSPINPLNGRQRTVPVLGRLLRRSAHYYLQTSATRRYCDVAVEVGAHHPRPGPRQYVEYGLAGMTITVVCSDTHDRYSRSYRSEEFLGVVARAVE
jgi:hypothetical protein